MTLTALIVDDEEYSRKSLFFLLDDYCPAVEVTGLAKSVEEAREFLFHNTVDIIFLDIAMPKQNGFELLPHIENNRTAVIFVTAYDQYALRALKASAVDYLLKPIDIEELKIAVTKAAERKAQKRDDQTSTSAINILTENLNEKKELSKLTIQHTQGFHIVDISDIMYIEADSNYSALYLKSNEKIVASKPLKDFEEILLTDNFVRIHKSIILNLNYLKNYSTANGFFVRLSNNKELPVSRRRSADFSDKLREYFT
ncbi:MAG TPA: LytTR family DNA-binding domain-containing protein [Sphingobacteriaceae bacterium]